MSQENIFALVRRPSSAIQKAAPGAKRVLANMITETLALAETKALITFLPNNSPLLEIWCRKGERYYEGTEVPQDYVEAAKWFRMAAEKGHAKAQYWFAVLHHGGEGIAQSLSEAAAWYRKAAEQGDDWGQFSLGQFYDSHYNFGDVIKHDDVEAVNWYRKAAVQGHAEAQASLGCCYLAGTGVPQDYDEAIQWLKKAAEQDNEGAKLQIASYYQNEGDLIEAYKWLKLAADQNDLWDGKFARLRSSMTEEQIVEGEGRYRDAQASKK